MIPKINHTQIPNYFLDNYLNKISLSATKVFLVICRKTIGWQKETDQIGIRKICELTGLSNKPVINAINELIEIGLIIKGDTKQYGTEYFINYSGGESTHQVVENIHHSGGESTPQVVEKVHTSKETIKRNYKKETIKSEDYRLLGDFKNVQLTQTQIDKLLQVYEKDLINKKIKDLSIWIECHKKEKIGTYQRLIYFIKKELENKK